MATERKSQVARERKSAEEYSYARSTEVPKFQPTPRHDEGEAYYYREAANTNGIPSSYEEFFTVTTSNKPTKATHEQKNVTKFTVSKIFFCILVALVSVILVAIACFIAAFIEVATLKSTSEEASARLLELNSSSTSTGSVPDDTTSVTLHLEQLNQTIRSLDNRIIAQINRIESTINNYSVAIHNASVQTPSCTFDEQQLQVTTNRITSDLTTIDQRISSQTSQTSQLNETVNNLYQTLEESMTLLNSYVGQTSIFSCASLPSSFPSGHYFVSNHMGSPVLAYCDMTMSCGGITGGWMRVAQMNVTSNGNQCPRGFQLRQDGANLHTCMRDDEFPGCGSIILQTQGVGYSRVCGRVTGYQFSRVDGFSVIDRASINGNYVDGVSITHGNPRQHIWTFAASQDRINSCPCQAGATQPPLFVGTDYFCDSGNDGSSTVFNFHTTPLWTGSNCLCCTNPPWFYKQVPQPTADDIEMRVCRDEMRSNEDVAIQQFEFYVQ